MIAAALLMATVLADPQDEFFIISSVDAAHSRIIMKRPTDVTAVVIIQAAARLRGERGESVHIADFRAGDTVYAVVKPTPEGPLIATSIRRGPMTVGELRRRYLPELPAQ